MAQNLPNSNSDQLTKNILKQCTICNEAISSRSTDNNDSKAEDIDGLDISVMCSDCIEYFTKIPQEKESSTASSSVDNGPEPKPKGAPKPKDDQKPKEDLPKSTSKNSSNNLEQCSLCSGEISKLDVTFQCDQHSEHVICNDCIEDQTCPYCNAPILERVATCKSPDFPIEKYTYVKKLGDASRGGKVYLYELQESETAPELPKVVIVKTLLKKPSDEKLVILSCGNHPRIVKVYGKCTVLGQFGIVMKGFDETLESYLEQVVLKTNEQVAIPEVKNILNQLAYALQFLYKKDLLHCEIKPENIFIRKHNNKVQAALIDIGVARLIQRVHKDPWMAPEATATDKPFYGHAADVYGFGLIAIYLRTWPTLPNEFSQSVELLQEAIGDDNLFELISDCLQYKPKNRIRKKDLVTHLFFQTTKEEIDKFKDILDEKVNLKNQLAAMKRECHELKSQSHDMLSVIDSKVQKLKHRTLELLEEEEEPPEVVEITETKPVEEVSKVEDQKDELSVTDTPSRPLSRRGTKKYQRSSRDSSVTRNDASKENTIVRKDSLTMKDSIKDNSVAIKDSITDYSVAIINSSAVNSVAIKDSSRENSLARKDNSKNRIDSKKEDSLLVKDSSKDDSQSLTQNGTIETKNENKATEKAQENIVQIHKPIEIDKKQGLTTNKEGLANKEPIKHMDEKKSDHSLTNGQDVKLLNSVKSSLPVEQPERDVDAVGDEQGVSYNLTGKLKVIDDMLINETQVHEEQADEISVSDVTLEELEDFNEEEDYVKFLQKENMSPMVPKLKADHKKLPLPVVTCEWSDKKSESSLSSYLPGLGRYSRFLGRSKRSNVKPEEELNLTLKFENLATKLPPKLQLEICDPDSGRVVFMKRQNIYYIKLQEKLATLDCGKNYVLKITSIKDNITSDEEVVIQKKDAEKSQDAAPMKAIKSSIGGKEVYLKQGILAEIGKKESLKEEHLVALKQFKPQEDEISGISYHDPPQFPGFKAKPQKQPDVYKRIVSDGKEKWINMEGVETKENEK